MLRNRVYFFLKPWIPRAVRLEIRKWHAKRLRVSSAGTWPIQPGSDVPPEGWPGWPDRSKFAVVLTHDVEGPRGLERCSRLMRLEQELGFRSSFNFIPEGPYRVSLELREELKRNGFEVGLHDLRHDGTLYASRARFRRSAVQINNYLREWGAVGFRSGFMLNALDWLHDVDIKYDASTFDTDPFEPQPKGRGTIFPFWMPRPDYGPKDSSTRQGYAELPYTLPQDSNLFLILGEEGPKIWLEKLDWIAERGGMALLNVHPDYIHFEGDASERATYPVEFYRTFLEKVRERYAGQYWQPLPAQMAEFVAEVKPRLRRLKPRRICMVTHSFYESDNRVLRYAEALVKAGDQVDVLALRQKPELPKEECIHGVNVHRVQDRFTKDGRGSIHYLLPLLRFLWRSFVALTREHRRDPYDLVHVHNIPDFMIFAALYPKCCGTRTILDIHDIVPEFYESKFDTKKGGTLARLLLEMERISASLADEIIIANDLWLERYAQRTGTNGRCRAMINYVDESIFHPSSNGAQKPEKLIVLFPGGLQKHQGVDVAINAFRQVAEKLPQAEFHIYGEGNHKDELVRLVAELGLGEKVRFFRTLGIREIASVIAGADLGIVPKRADSFGNEAYSTKIMEFMASGVPVVISSTKVDRFYFNDTVVRFFESGNPDSLAREMIDLLGNRELRLAQAQRALSYAEENSWERKKGRYLDLVDCLTS